MTGMKLAEKNRRKQRINEREEGEKEAKFPQINSLSLSLSFQGGQLYGKISPRTTIYFFADSSTSSLFIPFSIKHIPQSYSNMDFPPAGRGGCFNCMFFSANWSQFKSL